MTSNDSAPGSVIVAGARTPIGKLSGALASFSAADLGGFAISAALERAGVAPDEVDHVIMGQVLMAGQGQVPSRQAAVKAGIPMSVPSVNVNKVCLSGLNAIYLAHQMIAAGDADIVVAGGMESMTNAPYIADGARGGFRYGNTELADAIIKDGLWCAFDACLMGLGTENYAGGLVTREQQDDLAVKSNERAANAIKEGRLADEIVPVAVPQRRGEPILVEHDEGVRPGTTMESLAGLRPAFDPNGTITAANASQLSDGASALVLMSRAEAERRGVSPLGELVSYGMVAGPDNASLLTQPSRAILKAAERAGIDARRPRAVRDQRGVRRRRHRLDRRPRYQRRDRQRQRRRHRPRPSDRDERKPAGVDHAARVAPPWRWHRRRRPVWRRRPGRRGDPARVLIRSLGITKLLGTRCCVLHEVALRWVVKKGRSSPIRVIRGPIVADT